MDHDNQTPAGKDLVQLSREELTALIRKLKQFEDNLRFKDEVIAQKDAKIREVSELYFALEKTYEAAKADREVLEKKKDEVISYLTEDNRVKDQQMKDIRGELFKYKKGGLLKKGQSYAAVGVLAAVVLVLGFRSYGLIKDKRHLATMLQVAQDDKDRMSGNMKTMAILMDRRGKIPKDLGAQEIFNKCITLLAEQGDKSIRDDVLKIVDLLEQGKTEQAMDQFYGLKAYLEKSATK